MTHSVITCLKRDLLSLPEDLVSSCNLRAVSTRFAIACMKKKRERKKIEKSKSQQKNSGWLKKNEKTQKWRMNCEEPEYHFLQPRKTFIKSSLYRSNFEKPPQNLRKTEFRSKIWYLRFFPVSSQFLCFRSGLNLFNRRRVLLAMWFLKSSSRRNSWKISALVQSNAVWAKSCVFTQISTVSEMVMVFYKIEPWGITSTVIYLGQKFKVFRKLQKLLEF